MFKKYNLLSKKILCLMGLLSFMVAGHSVASESDGYDDDKKVSKRVTPKGYKKYIVIFGKGEYKSVDGTRLLNGLEGGDGHDFQHKSMKRSHKEIAKLKQEAKDFFVQKFGLDADSDDRVSFTGFQIDPRNNLRAYSVSDEYTPLLGWEVESGGWQMTVVDPAGVTLGGEFAGKNIHVAKGVFFVFGDYKINRSNDNDGKDEDDDDNDKDDDSPIIIRYKTANPYARTSRDGFILVDAESEKWGKGAAGGNIFGSITEDGLLNTRTRTIITFPALPETN